MNVPSGFNATAYNTPTEGRLVEALDSGGAKHMLRFKHNLWWTPDFGMYVYFRPLAWRYADRQVWKEN